MNPGVALRVIRFTLNGKSVSARIAPHHNLVEMLQDSFGLFGARESCGQGLCGCCTVLVNGVASGFIPFPPDALYRDGSIQLLHCPAGGGSVELVYEECFEQL